MINSGLMPASVGGSQKNTYQSKKDKEINFKYHLYSNFGQSLKKQNTSTNNTC